MKSNKIALGTVQWGMNYGISNKKGIPSNNELDKIISLARINGINLLDTAKGYGDAEERIGKERMKGAYAYKNLLNRYGKIALGTDFPVEKVNPFLTFYSAAARRDLNNFPEDGFQMENALTRQQTLKGMTIWAAFSNFEEDEKGSIEVGKFADFIILNQDIMEIYGDEIPKTKVVATYLDGEKVYGE